MNNFFTFGTFKTLAGSTLAVILIVNCIQHATGWNERWFALVVALGVSIGTSFLVKSGTSTEPIPKPASRVFLALINGFMIYSAAFGIQNNVVAGEPTTEVITLEEEVVTIQPRSTTVEFGPDYEAEDDEAEGDEPAPPFIPGSREPIVVPAVHEIMVREVIRKVPKAPDVRQFRSKW